MSRKDSEFFNEFFMLKNGSDMVKYDLKIFFKSHEIMFTWFMNVLLEVQYIGDDADSSNSGKNGVINNSKELLMGLEERKKAAAEVTTVPLRQPLCANYKSIVTSANTRQNSFMGKPRLFALSSFQITQQGVEIGVFFTF